eukprot:TRINITY_DN733_c1_g1_i1.p1 TRINITY_DN733_c1_g1~~TRINITY_DN733_c1_g1_i1.p1  ORF type:complete len:1032 (+),score=201.65 TRINITY_DN733_c1_g1_i1:63-3098(+)
MNCLLLLLTVILTQTATTEGYKYSKQWNDTTLLKGRIIDSQIGGGGRATVLLCEKGIFYYNEFWYYASEKSGTKKMGYSVHSIPDTETAVKISLASEAGILAAAFENGTIAVYKIYFQQAFRIATIPPAASPVVDLSITSTGSAVAVARNDTFIIYTMLEAFSHTEPINSNASLEYATFEKTVPYGQTVKFILFSPLGDTVTVMNTDGGASRYDLTDDPNTRFAISTVDAGDSCDPNDPYYRIDRDYNYYKDAGDNCESLCLADTRCTSFMETEGGECTLWYNGNCNSDLSRAPKYDRFSVHFTRYPKPILSAIQIGSSALKAVSYICRSWDNCTSDLFSSQSKLSLSRLSGLFKPEKYKIKYGTLGAFYSPEAKIAGVWRLLPPFSSSRPQVLFRSTDIVGFASSEQNNLLFEVRNGSTPTRLSLTVKELVLGKYSETFGSANITNEVTDIDFSCGSPADYNDDDVRVTSSARGEEVLISFRGCVQMISIELDLEIPSNQFSKQCLNKPSLIGSLTQCRDGSTCTTQPGEKSCCDFRSGVLGCPPERPLLCQDATCGPDKMDSCCSTTCDTLGGVTSCFGENHNVRFEEARTTEKTCAIGFQLVSTDVECYTAVQHLDPTATNTSTNVIVATKEDEGLSTKLPICYYDGKKSSYIYNQIGFSDFRFFVSSDGDSDDITPLCVLRDYVALGFKNTKCFDIFNYPNIRSESRCKEAYQQVLENAHTTPVPAFAGARWGGTVDRKQRMSWPTGCFYSPELNEVMFNFPDDSAYKVTNEYIAICSTKLDNDDWVIPGSSSGSSVIGIVFVVIGFLLFLVSAVFWVRWNREHRARMATLREIGPHIETVDVKAHLKKYTDYISTLVIPLIPPEEVATDCSICLESLSDMDCVHLPGCDHHHHLECLLEYVQFRIEKERKKYPKCPLCRVEIRLPKRKESLWKRLQDDSHRQRNADTDTDTGRQSPRSREAQQQQQQQQQEEQEPEEAIIDMTNDTPDPLSNGSDVQYIELQDIAE